MKNLEKAFGLSPADLAEMEALDKRVEQAKKNFGKHTPGPWDFMADSTGQYLAIFARTQGGPTIICPVKIADKADAHLIAAAPELLATLKDINTVIQSGGDFRLGPKGRHHWLVDSLMRLIAKAEGGAQ